MSVGGGTEVWPASQETDDLRHLSYCKLKGNKSQDVNIWDITAVLAPA